MNSNFFPNNLKFLRTKKGITQTELSKLMDKDYSTIGKWELGQRNPIMADMLKLSEIFNVSIQDLIGRDLRIAESENNTTPEYELAEDEKYKTLLKEKGLMDENNVINEEALDKLLKIADILQDTEKK